MGNYTTKGVNMKYVENGVALVVQEKRTVVVNNELSLLVKKHGCVTPKMICEVAEKKDHPLHKYFEWDDSLAGKKYRLMQATNMILASKFVCMLESKKNSVDVSKNQVRKLLPSFDEKHAFRERAEALGDEENRKMIVDRKIGVLRSWCESVVDISELLPLREKILSAI